MSPLVITIINTSHYIIHFITYIVPLASLLCPPSRFCVQKLYFYRSIWEKLHLELKPNPLLFPSDQLTVETTGASSPLASTLWAPLLMATPEPQRKSTCLLACRRRAGWTLSCTKLRWSPALRRKATSSRQWARMSASTLTTSTSATPWWLMWVRTARIEERSPGGGTTLPCQADLPLPGCWNTTRALIREGGRGVCLHAVYTQVRL